MTTHWKKTILAATLAALSGGATAQMAYFDADDYGQTDLLVRESTGNASTYIASNKGAFEPIRELPKDDPIRQLALAVGRVDLLSVGPDGTRGLGTCTGSVLPGGWVITNHHCIPGRDGHELLAASILIGYLEQGKEDSNHYRLSVDPSDTHEFLDFSLVRLQDIPPNVTPLVFEETLVDPGDSLMVIHHPLGRPQVMTRFRCFAARSQDDGPILRHRCDTQPGSSGSILFDREMRPVALHHSGGMTADDDTSFNKSTRISDILAQSGLLRDISTDAVEYRPTKAPQVAPPPQVEASPPSPGLSAGGINDLLRSN